METIINIGTSKKNITGVKIDKPFDEIYTVKEKEVVGTDSYNDEGIPTKVIVIEYL